MKENNGPKQSVEPERERVVAYLSYAQEDVRALSAVGAYFLLLTIAALAEERTGQAKVSVN